MDTSGNLTPLFLLCFGVMFIGMIVPQLSKRLLRFRNLVVIFFVLFLVSFLLLTRLDAQAAYFWHHWYKGLEVYFECDIVLPTDEERYEKCRSLYNTSAKVDTSPPEDVEQYWRWLIIPPPLRPTCESVNAQICEITSPDSSYTSYAYPILILLSGLVPFISVAATWFILKSRRTS